MSGTFIVKCETGAEDVGAYLTILNNTKTEMEIASKRGMLVRPIPVALFGSDALFSIIEHLHMIHLFS